MSALDCLDALNATQLRMIAQTRGIKKPGRSKQQMIEFFAQHNLKDRLLLDAKHVIDKMKPNAAVKKKRKSDEPSTNSKKQKNDDDDDDDDKVDDDDEEQYGYSDGEEEGEEEEENEDVEEEEEEKQDEEKGEEEDDKKFVTGNIQIDRKDLLTFFAVEGLATKGSDTQLIRRLVNHTLSSYRM